MDEISLSPSKLSVFLECKKCFWDSYAADCPKPRGIFPSLPGGMDLVMKNYFEQFRGSLPPILKGEIPGVLMADRDKMKKWRFWKTGPSYIDVKNKIKLVGALDDCLVDGDIYIPLDVKTKGSEPKTDGSEYYQNQLDCYNLMLEGIGHKVRDEGWLVYIYPQAVALENIIERRCDLNIVFGLKPFMLPCDKERAKTLIIKAAECLRGPRPQSSMKCEHCRYLAMEDELTRRIKQ